MKVIELRSDAELHGMRSSWNSLLAQSPSNTIFLTWEWASAWWASYGRLGQIRILAAFDGDKLRGLAPLCRQTHRGFGQSVRALALLGDGSNDSDYLDFIIAAGFELPVMDAFRSHFVKELNAGTLLALNEIPETSASLPLLRDLARAGGFLWRESNVPCSTVTLPDSWDKYLGGLKPRFRSKVRSVLRDMEGRPEVQWGFCETPQEVDALLPKLFDLHTRRWARDAKPGVFGTAEKRSFYNALSPLLQEQRWLRFSWLNWNDRVLACQYGFAYNGTYFQLQEGYEPDSEHLNAGIALRAWSIREFIKGGLREYDFMGGVGRHKSDWGSHVKTSKRIILTAATVRNRLYCQGPEWKMRTRETIKSLLPEKIVAARAAVLEQRRLAGFPRDSNEQVVGSSGGTRIREVAARFYVHSGLPVLARSVRRRFQLSAGSNGRMVSLHKRKEPCARILCFHRINEDHDPFFPAVSTAVFEQVMRFLARHHKVVSLGEALQHLESKSRESVLAVTFDDGYQDNYLHAFPILRRYGLPATVFLTTGSVDSRDPLWFEVLAGALKCTSRESIDLTTDIPRRFWLRTASERLQANGRMFSYLRGLSDSERQLHLSGILRELGSEQDTRRDQMLTWDQVRLMKAGGIDFGGHTVNHPFLSRIPPQRVTWEISECKRRIEDELQHEVEHFAYPNGREEDFGQANKELLRAAGYKAAVTTIWGVNYVSTDRMELKRSGPWEDDPALFACKLDWYQLLND